MKIKKKPILFSILILVFTLTACSNPISSMINASKLEEEFENINSLDTYEMKTTTTIQVRKDNVMLALNKASHTVKYDMSEDYYVEVSIDGITTITQYESDDHYYTYTYDPDYKLKGINIIDKQVLTEDPLEASQDEILVSDIVSVRKDDDAYIVRTPITNILTKDDIDVIDSIFHSLDASYDVSSSDIDITYEFDDDNHLNMNVDVDLESDEYRIIITIDSDVTFKDIERFNFDSDDIYIHELNQPGFTKVDEVSLDDGFNKVFGFESEYDYYQVYLEAGMYAAINGNNSYNDGVYIYDEDKKVLTNTAYYFDYIYSSAGLPDERAIFYISTSGQYYVRLKSSTDGYQLKFEKLAYENIAKHETFDKIEDVANIDLEGAYDFVHLDIDTTKTFLVFEGDITSLRVMFKNDDDEYARVSFDNDNAYDREVLILKDYMNHLYLNNNFLDLYEHSSIKVYTLDAIQGFTDKTNYEAMPTLDEAYGNIYQCEDKIYFKFSSNGESFDIIGSNIEHHGVDMKLYDRAGNLITDIDRTIFDYYLEPGDYYIEINEANIYCSIRYERK